MPIESSPPLNINIQIKTISAAASTEISSNVTAGASEAQAPNNFGGRTVKLIADVGKWAANETAAYARSAVKDTVKDIKAGAAFVARKFSEAMHSLYDKFQLYRADKKANKEWKLSSAKVEKRDTPSTKATQLLQSPKRENHVSSHLRKFDQETKDIQTRLNLLKLPDAPTTDPNI
jgi:transketolase